MISVEEAIALLRQHKADFGTEAVPLLQASGRVLAQAVTADRDLPPFDRVTMDGIAIRYEAFEAGRLAFHIEGVQPAGAPQQTLQNPAHCLEVMTGAMLPEGADTIIPYEACALSDGVATVTAASIKSQQFIHRQGTDSQTGEVLVPAGERITPAVVGILASVGLATVPVRRLPRVAVFSTGDELVPVTEQPLAHQIRQSNVYMLAAALQAEHIPADLFHLPDEQEEMARQLEEALAKYEVLLFSGAVSRGKYDFLPAVLERLGLQQVFHRVAQKPGKPMLFGIVPGKATVFGFPGNPVSSFVCYHVFFKPWLQASLGDSTPPLSAILDQDIVFKPSLTYHVPVRLRFVQGLVWATPIAGSGSADLTSIVPADALLSLPPGQEQFQAGESYPMVRVR